MKSFKRHRRLRQSKAIRRLVSETRLTLDPLIMPLFVKEGLNRPKEIVSMPGQYQWPVSHAVSEAKKIFDLGIPAIMLFGIPKYKDAKASSAILPNGFIQKTISSIKKRCPELLVIADICLCEYTHHGHCGIVEKGKVINDVTLKLLSAMAVSCADSGADIVAPSDMMDGRIQAVRQALDNQKLTDTLILSYGAKYASGFYGPFREAAENSPRFGDRSSYQMNPANAIEALSEIKTDIREGADLVLVKPALAYGDIIQKAADTFYCPIGCYNVSGEYAMVKAAAQRGWIDEKKIVMEQILSFRRAGARFIVTYWAKDLAKWIPQ